MPLMLTVCPEHRVWRGGERDLPANLPKQKLSGGFWERTAMPPAASLLLESVYLMLSRKGWNPRPGL